jgi:hypothetical protein
MKSNKEKYTLGYIFLCRGVATKILIGYSIFKGTEGITTVYDDEIVKKAIKFIGLGLNSKFAKNSLIRDFHTFGAGEWEKMSRYMNGVTKLGELKTIALKGNETEEDYKKILKVLI